MMLPHNFDKSEFEVEELRNRVSAVDTGEMKIIAQMLPDFVIWEEIQSRYNKAFTKIRIIEKALSEGDTEI